MHYEPVNGFLFVEEGKEEAPASGFKVHGGENSATVEAKIISPGDTGYAPGEVVIFPRHHSMKCSLGERVGILVHKDHVLVRVKT